jgi:hypothetical protein
MHIRYAGVLGTAMLLEVQMTDRGTLLLGAGFSSVSNEMWRATWSLVPGSENSC